MRLRLRLNVSTSIATTKDRIRRRLQNILHDLPNNLPEFDEEQVTDDLCFLLQSPHFLYAIQSRLRHEYLRVDSEVSATTIGSLGQKADETKSVEIDARKLNITIKWDRGSWATQFLHGKTLLLEGRQINVTQAEGFAQSFHWFCEELRFLWFQFKAQEIAATEQKEGKAMILQGNQRNKVVVLKIGVYFVGGKAVLAEKRV